MIKKNSADKPEQIAVITVNYNTAELTIQAIESALQYCNDIYDVRVYLVDNASPRGDAATLCEAHKTRQWGARVQLFLESDNHGFGRGNNVVLNALAKADVPPAKVFLLNPDAQLKNDAIAYLAATLDTDPQAGAAGASIVRPDSSPVTAAFRFPSALSEIARVIGLGFLDRLMHNKLVALPPTQPAGTVDWVSGACVMFRFEALKEVGFFDPGFFLYYEEVDLMRRLKKVGWHVLYEPKAKVVHEEGAATGQFAGSAGRQRDPWYLYQSWTHYFTGAYGPRCALAIALMLWPAALVNILHRSLRGRTPTVPSQFFHDHWQHVVRPLLSAAK